MSREKVKQSGKATVRKPVSPKARPAQPDDFVSVARRHEADEDKARFEKALGKIARAKPGAKTT